MFIGIKKVKRSFGAKAKTLYILWMPFVKVKLTRNTKKIKILGVLVYNSTLLESQPMNSNVDNNLNFRAIELELLLKAVSKNLREFKRFENQLVKKFPDLKNKVY